MDIDQLKQFCLIVETGTMADASRLLHLSAGAISRSMQRLADEVGFELFKPDGRNILVTEQGKSLFKLANQTLFEFNSGLKQIRHKNTFNAPIRIASFEVFTTYVMSELIKSDFPTEELLILERTPGDIEERVTKGDADIGITYAPVVSQDLTFTKVTSFKMGAFRQGRKFDATPFEQIPFAVPTTPLQVNLPEIEGLDGWPKNATARNIKYRFELLETALLACQNGDCAIFMPEFIANLVNRRSLSAYQLVALPLPAKIEKPKFDIYLVTRKSLQHDLIIKRFAQGIKKVCRSDY